MSSRSRSSDSALRPSSGSSSTITRRSATIACARPSRTRASRLSASNARASVVVRARARASPLRRACFVYVGANPESTASRVRASDDAPAARQRERLRQVRDALALDEPSAARCRRFARCRSSAARGRARATRSVDFPAPAGPEIPATSPAATRNETSSSARAGRPNRRRVRFRDVTELDHRTGA